MTKIAICSDLHQEFAPVTLTNTEGAKVLILSGDIMTAIALHDNPRETCVAPPGYLWKPSHGQTLAMRYREFLKHVSNEYEHVVEINGNHESYHGNFPDTITWIRDELANYPNIHFLEKEHIVIDDVTFVGGTLWTDLNKSDPMSMYAVEQGMNDFRVIRNSQHGYRRFLPQDTVQEHRATLAYIKQVVEIDPDKKYVICGHHAPCSLSIDPRYANDYHMNGGYYSDLSDFILDHPQIELWTHGHMHNSSDYMMGDTRVVCNPRGYPGEESFGNFQVKFLDI